MFLATALQVGAAYRGSSCNAPVPASSSSISSSQLPTQPSGGNSARPPSASTAASAGLLSSAAASVLSTATSVAPTGSNAPGAVTVTGDPTQRLLFRDPKLHVNLLSLALEVSTTPSGQLDALFWQQYPLDNGQQYNLEYLLMWHLNNGNGAAAAGPELRRRLEAAVAQAQAGAGSAALPAAVASMLGASRQAQARAARAQLRLLKLLTKSMFDSSRYSELKFMARGAYSSVYRAKARLPAAAAASGSTGAQLQQQVIIKTVALPSSRYDRCVLPDIYGEIAIMDQYKDCPGICQMLDYGLTDDAFWIVMKKYRCSLAEWRQRQALGPTSAPAAALYLAILLQVRD